MRLRGKTLNAVDELGSSQAITSEVFKGIITGNPRTARDLYKSAEEIYPVALHVFATNRLPPFRGGFDNGVRRRLMVLPMTRVIPEDERVPGIGARTVALESQALLAFVVDGASRLIRQGH
jgi:putative DNA primase/helicase